MSKQKSYYELEQIKKAIFRTEKELSETNELLLLLWDYINENPVIKVEFVRMKEVSCG